MHVIFIRFIYSITIIIILSACTGQSTSVGNINSILSQTKNFIIRPSISQMLPNIIWGKNGNFEKNKIDYTKYSDENLWIRIQKGFQMPDLKCELVKTHVNWYSSKPEYLARIIERSQKYLYHIVEQIEDRNMPTELALLPFVESAYNPRALSTAKAAGIWQFIPGTGKRYNLKQNMWQDDRHDVVASTSAALDYLLKLYNMLGDWHLALASYNWGEGNIQKAISKNQLLGLPTNYQNLRLPSETRNYVPKLQAIKNIILNPSKYRLKFSSIPNHPYFIAIKTKKDIDLDIAAKLANITTTEFKSLNPSFKKPIIIAATNPKILLPYKNANIFKNNLKKYKGRLSLLTTYTVSKKTRLSAIAKKIGTNPNILMSINKIPVGMRLKSGSTLLVPRYKRHHTNISAGLAKHAILAIEPDVPDKRKMFIKVRYKESASKIANSYGVSLSQLKFWNKKIRLNSLKPGQMLILYVHHKYFKKNILHKNKYKKLRVYKDSPIIKKNSISRSRKIINVNFNVKRKCSQLQINRKKISSS